MTMDETEDRLSVPPVVVGVLDESPGGWDAVRWAAAEASRRRTELRLVSAYEVPHRGLLAYDVVSPAYPAMLADRWRFRHLELTAQVTQAYPDLPVTSVVRNGHTVAVLLHESAHAVMLVVPIDRGGRLHQLTHDPVAFSTISHATVPVAVVRTDAAGGTAGPVVVGVDGSPHSDSAVAFAFDAAAARSVGLLAVHAWSDTAFGDDDLDGLIGPDQVRDIERTMLTEALGRWRDKYPQVAMTPVVVSGDPARHLLDRTAAASMVVVGHRGRGGFTDALLGSISQALIVAARCPVVVTRTSGGASTDTRGRRDDDPPTAA
jgi:nucleotide-binding universal stress UspA family protein